MAWHLATVIDKLDNYYISYIYSKSHSAIELSNELGVSGGGLLEQALKADIVIIAVSDDNIEKVVKDINGLEREQKPLLIHTAGSVGMSVLRTGSKRVGVLYPLQTLSKGVKVDFRKLPLLINASREQDELELLKLARRISDNVNIISDENRKKIHLAAVMVNNFVNHLLFQASEFLNEEKLDFSLLRPLIEETINKSFEIGPGMAQTGPAKRNDRNTIEKHQALLMAHHDLYQIYELFTDLIVKTYKK